MPTISACLKDMISRPPYPCCMEESHDFTPEGVTGLNLVPEPSTWVLLLGGLVLLAWGRRRMASKWTPVPVRASLSRA